jgi:hypothetical protein
MIIEWLQQISAIFPHKENLVSEGLNPSGSAFERRVFLGAPAAMAASFVLRSAMTESAGDLSFEDLTKQATGYSARLAAGGGDEEEYVLTIAALAVRLKEIPPPKFGEPFKGVISSALSFRGEHMAFVQWRMGPNSVYQPHNHPNYNGMTLGLQGECRMRNFDFVGPKPEYSSKATFLIRETQDGVLRPGRVTSMMTTTRDNVHELHAGKEGATGLDIFTRMGPAEGFALLSVRSKPKDEGTRTYEAVWEEHIKEG